MPTKGEMADVAQRVMALTSERFWANGEFLRPVVDGPPGAGTPWWGLSRDDRREAIFANTYWEGFSPEEQAATVAMVAEGEAHAFFSVALGEGVMPSLDRVQEVSQKIGWLESMSYLHVDGEVPQPSSDCFLPWWKDLSAAEKTAVLSTDVNWDGFTEQQKQAVISRVVAGEGPESPENRFQDILDGKFQMVEQQEPDRGRERER
jgi:hypothetical protein